MALEFIVSEKGHRKLLTDGYPFVKDRMSDTKIYWKCDKFAVMKCHARIHTEADRIVRRVGDHNHAADVASVEAAKVVRDAQLFAINSPDTNAPPDKQLKMPCHRHMVYVWNQNFWR